MTAAIVDRPAAVPEAITAPPHPRPRWTAVAREQLRTVLGALRWQTLLGAAGLVLVTLVTLLNRVNAPGPAPPSGSWN